MGIFKVGASWYFRFRFHGRRIKRSVGRISKHLAQMAEDAERRRLAEEYATGRWKLPTRNVGIPHMPTLAEYVRDTYLPQHLPRVAPSSQRQYRSLASKLVDAIGNYRLDELGPKVLDGWSAARLSGTEGLRRVSAAQVVNDGRALAAIINHARARVDPADG